MKAEDTQVFSKETVSSDFPILEKTIHGKRLVYLDNAATSQKPNQVMQAIVNYYQFHNANVKRGAHQLSDESTELFETSRKTIAQFFGADPDELILTHNTTHAINGVAYGWADYNLTEGDVILTSLMEHHSNLVTWQEVEKRIKAKVSFIRVDEEGRIDLKHLEEKLIELPVKLVSLVHISNTLGVINPIAEITALVKKHRPKARVLVDGAQAAPHLAINFAKLGVDFYTFSGHKMLAPMGVGGMFVRRELLESGEIQPWVFGGGMIDTVTIQNTKFNADTVDRFSAGTPDVASTLGLAAACDYLSKLGMDRVEAHDRDLVAYTIKRLQEFPQVTVVGPVEPPAGAAQLDRLGLVAFTYEGVHPHDVGQVLDSEGVEVRTGHHCTQPLHTYFGWQGTTRVSFQIYNTHQDIDVFIQALHKVKKVFGK